MYLGKNNNKYTFLFHLKRRKIKKQMLHKNDLEHNFTRKGLKNVKTLTFHK